MFLILEHAAHDPQVRCLLWTAAGRAFNSGADWNSTDQADEAAAAIPEPVMQAYLARGMGHPLAGTDVACKNLTLAFWDFPKPSVCAVNGLAVGGGANMALANYHDYVICSEQAKFLWPFTRLGLTPELGSSRALPVICGLPRAKELLMLNRWCPAEQALRYGLCNEMVSASQLLARGQEVAREFAASNGTALRLTKQIIHRHSMDRDSLARLMDTENEVILKAFTSEETRERAAAAAAAKKKKKAAAKNASKL